MLKVISWLNYKGKIFWISKMDQLNEEQKAAIATARTAALATAEEAF